MNQAMFFHPTYAYQFSVPPAVHGADLKFTFYDFEPTTGVNTTVAEIMQYYTAQFAQMGRPNAPGLPSFPQRNPDSWLQNLGNDFVGPISDDRESSNCRTGAKSGRILRI